ncbi:MAG: right-handed parallel beta-helix repeat-containing protein [Salinibacterium sp.]|nr:right-handed parallel beta-helix repeat-containing protein [Salinibacterium sp.]
MVLVAQRMRLGCVVGLGIAAALLVMLEFPGAARAATTIEKPRADTYVDRMTPRTSHGNGRLLQVRGGSDATRAAYLRFDVSGVDGAVVRAVLRVYVANGSSDGPAVRSVRGAWGEGLLWSGRPRIGASIADVRKLGVGWYEYDVTRAIGGNGTFDLALVSTSRDGTSIGAREGARGARLVVTTSTPRTIVDSTKPLPPQGVTATALGLGATSLTWDAAPDDVGVVAYLIYRGDSPDPAVTLDASVRSWLDVDPAARSTTTSYSIRARDAAGNVSAPAVVAAPRAIIEPDVVPPTAPLSVTCVSQEINAVVISWGAASDEAGIGGYLVYRFGSSVPVAILDASARTYTDMGLTAGTEYSYVVRARDTSGNLGPASTVLVTHTASTADVNPPSSPASVTATATSGTTIALAWGGATDNVAVTGYLVYRNGSSTASAMLGATARSFTDSTLSATTTYSYVVRAVDAAGNLGVASLSVSATTADVSTPGANLPISYSLSSITGVTYFVATTGSDANSGTSVGAPLATVAAAIAKISSGSATIVVRGGIYRQGSLNIGASRAIRIIAYPGETPVFDGSQDLASGWTIEGSLQYHSYTAMPVTDAGGITFTTGMNLTGDFVGKYPDQAWLGSTPLRQVSAKASVVDGTFYVDSMNGRIYLTAADVAIGGVAASSLRQFLKISGAGSAIEGIRITRFSNTASDYGVVLLNTGANNVTMRNVDIHDAAFTTVWIAGGSSQSTIIQSPVFDHVTISGSNFMGIQSTLVDNLVLSKSNISDSNRFGEFATSPQSGALKTSRNRNIRIVGNEFDRNNSHGLWFDQSNVAVLVAGNRMLDNTGSSIFFEISDDLLLIDNYIRSAGGNGVKLAGSSGLRLVGNTIVSGRDPLGIYTDIRSLAGCSDPSQPVCPVSYSSDRDAVRSPLPSTLDWMPRLDLMIDNVIAYPTGSSLCGISVPVCITTSNGTTTRPIETIIHQADPVRGIPQTRIDGNVYANGTGAIMRAGSAFTSLSAFTSAMLAAPVSISGIDASSKAGTGWINADGSPTPALAAASNQAVAIPIDPKINEFIPAGTQRYGSTITG